MCSKIKGLHQNQRNLMSKALKILITSQKGGVGKSTVSANLAAYFAYISGKKTSLIDFDHQATSGKWVKKAYPIGINCQTVDLPNAKGSGVALLKAKESLRKSVETMEVVIADLTWADVLPPDFLFEFDLVLVPSSLSRVELDSTLEFVNRFSFVFNSRMRNPPKLVIVPSRVDNLQTYEGIFSKSFNAGFFLSPPVMYSNSAGEFFGNEFFVMTTNEEIRENFLDFGRSIEQLGQTEADIRQASKHGALTQKVSGSILDRFRAVRNSTPEPVQRPAVNDSTRMPVARSRIKAAIPSFLMMGRDG
jgi:cellulose biosynthesis protein BcsQ